MAKTRSFHEIFADSLKSARATSPNDLRVSSIYFADFQPANFQAAYTAYHSGPMNSQIKHLRDDPDYSTLAEAADAIPCISIYGLPRHYCPEAEESNRLFQNTNEALAALCDLVRADYYDNEDGVYLAKDNIYRHTISYDPKYLKKNCLKRQEIESFEQSNITTLTRGIESHYKINTIVEEFTDEEFSFIDGPLKMTTHRLDIPKELLKNKIKEKISPKLKEFLAAINNNGNEANIILQVPSAKLMAELAVISWSFAEKLPSYQTTYEDNYGIKNIQHVIEVPREVFNQIMNTYSINKEQEAAVEKSGLETPSFAEQEQLRRVAGSTHPSSATRGTTHTDRLIQSGQGRIMK